MKKNAAQCTELLENIGTAKNDIEWEHLVESTPSNAIGEKFIVCNREVNGGMRKQKSL